MEKLKNIKCFLLDLDGTVYLSGTVLPGAAEAVARMRKQGKVFFVTNNTPDSRSSLVKKLREKGIDSTEDDFYTASNATADYLNYYHPGKKVCFLGTEAFRQEFSRYGIQTTDTDPDLVVVAFDTDLNYKSLAKVCGFIRKGVPYLATHPDINCPTAAGDIPDVGSFLALIEKSTGKSPFIICGKPFWPMADGIKKLINCQPREIAMIGDRLSTDILFAKSNGFVSVLVLTGEIKSNSIYTNVQPDIVLDSIALWDAECIRYAGGEYTYEI